MPETPAFPLFDATELTNLLGTAVSEERARAAEHVVWGWMQPLLGVEERPQPLTPQQYGWAIQLGAIAHENPAGLSSKQVGGVREDYSAERRQEILDDIEAANPGVISRAPMPRASFPKIDRQWDDPISEYI